MSASEPDGTVNAHPAGAPALRIVRGEPTDAEVAAVTAVLLAAAATTTATAPAGPPRRGRWGDPSDLLRQPLHPGQGAWSAVLRQR